MDYGLNIGLHRVIQKSLCTCKNTNIFVMLNLQLLIVKNTGRMPHMLADKHLPDSSCWRRHLPIQNGDIPSFISDDFLQVTATKGIVFVS
jgi:hypothetical protein